MTNDVATRWVDDRTLEMSTLRPDGLYAICRIGWSTAAEAEANYEGAIRDFRAKRIADIPRQVGEGSKTWKIPHTRLYFTIVWGPPTWLLPRAYIRRRAFGLGWLRRGFVIGSPVDNTPSST